MITKVMVAEDNAFVFSCYQKFFSQDKSIEFVGYAKDGETALTMYKELKPDLLFLDLKLPKKNGLEILDDLTKEENEKNKCNVVIISGDLELRQSLYNTRKVYRVIPKPIPHENLERTIQDFKSEQIENEFPINECTNLLIKLALNPYSKGGRLLIDTIKLCYCNLDLLDNISQIYFILASKESCSYQKIKSRLRSIVNTVNKYSSFNVLKKIFYLENNHFNISPKHFINGIIVYLKNNQKK